LNALAGFLALDSWSILLRDGGTPVPSPKRIYVSQEPSTFPWMTVEEAYLLASWLKGLSPDITLAMTPARVSGEDDTYPKDVHGKPVQPVKFTIRAEKCPNRRGVEEVLTHFEGKVTPFADVLKEAPAAVWFAGGYPVKEAVEAELPTDWKPPALLV